MATPFGQPKRLIIMEQFRALSVARNPGAKVLASIAMPRFKSRPLSQDQQLELIVNLSTCNLKYQSPYIESENDLYIEASLRQSITLCPERSELHGIEIVTKLKVGGRVKMTVTVFSIQECSRSHNVTFSVRKQHEEKK